MKKFIGFVAILFAMTSCATLFSGTKSTIQLNSEPYGAKVQVDGIDRGVTPTAIKLKKGSEGQIITLKKEGYETKTFQPETNFNTLAIVNLFNVVFWGIDALSGALYKYDPKSYNIELEPIKTSGGNK
jgi:PEGA domain